MKKTLSILLALALVLCMGTVTVFAAPTTDAYMTLTSDVSSAKVGDVVTFTVTAYPDSAQGLSAIGFSVKYDPAAFELVSTTNPNYFPGSSFYTDVPGSANYSAATEGVINSAGTVVTVSLKVLKTNSEVRLDVDCFGLGDYDATDVFESVIANSAGKTAITIACAHVYGEWAVKTPSTCQVAGEEVRVCTACGVEETRALELAAHTPGDWEVVAEATCTEAGERVQKCTVCGEVLASEAIPALGHDIAEDAWTVTVVPDCETDGEKTATCARCNETVTEAIPALGHDVTAWEVTAEPDCETAGEKVGTCNRCDKTVTEAIPALGHDFGEWKVVKEATETETGLKERVCKTCGEKETVAIDKLSPAVTTDSRNPDIPKTNGVVAGSIAAFAMLSMAAGVAAVTMKKKHEDD